MADEWRQKRSLTAQHSWDRAVSVHTHESEQIIEAI